MPHELVNLQVWKSTINDRVIERTIVDAYVNNRGSKTIKFTNVGSNVKYSEREEKFLKWIALHKAVIKPFEKPIKPIPDLIVKEPKDEPLQEDLDKFIQDLKEDTSLEVIDQEKDPQEFEKKVEGKIPFEEKFPYISNIGIKNSEKGVTQTNSSEKIKKIFNLKMDDRVCVYIDSQNFFITIKNLDIDFDYKKLHDHLNGICNLVRCNYYCALDTTESYNSRVPLIDWLQYNSYNVSVRYTQIYKANIDSDLIVDVMSHAYKSRLDHIILFSGDGDYTKMIKSVQELGIKVTVVSTLKSADCSDVLRRQADYFVDVYDMRKSFSLD